VSEQIDSFEEEFQRWLHSIHTDAKARREEANLIDLVNSLQERGHSVTYDYFYRYIFVDAEKPRSITITMQVARQTDPQVLMQWVEERGK
jgi:hypothetical protein